MPKPRLTVGLLNWKRHDNLLHLIHVLRQQTEPVKLFLFNNSPKPFDMHGLDWKIESNRNILCMARWWMLQHADTEYVTSFDDDLAPYNEHFVRKLLERLDSRNYARQIVGSFGIRLQRNVVYKDCPEAKPGEACDIVLGRQLALSTEALKEITIPFHDQRWNACDDICISARLNDCNHRHRIFYMGVANLHDYDGLCQRPYHYDDREAARKEFCQWVS